MKVIESGNATIYFFSISNGNLQRVRKAEEPLAKTCGTIISFDPTVINHAHDAIAYDTDTI